MMCETVEDIHERRGLKPWSAASNQLMFVTMNNSESLLNIFCRCMAHVINLANVDFMANITKIAAVETTQAIWEYDPSLPENRVLSGSLDVIAAIQTLAVKVCTLLNLTLSLPAYLLVQIQASGQ